MTDNNQLVVTCCRRGCTYPEQVFNCGAKECESYPHLRCYEAVLNKNKLDPLIGYDNQPVVVCTKKCYARYSKSNPASEDDNTRILWHMDGKNGPEDSNHSENIIVKWL